MDYKKGQQKKHPFYFCSMTNYLVGFDNPKALCFYKIEVYSVILKKKPSPSGYR